MSTETPNLVLFLLGLRDSSKGTMGMTPLGGYSCSPPHASTPPPTSSSRKRQLIYCLYTFVYVCVLVFITKHFLHTHLPPT